MERGQRNHGKGQKGKTTMNLFLLHRMWSNVERQWWCTDQKCLVTCTCIHEKMHRYMHTCLFIMQISMHKMHEYNRETEAIWFWRGRLVIVDRRCTGGGNHCDCLWEEPQRSEKTPPLVTEQAIQIDSISISLTDMIRYLPAIPKWSI